MTSHRATGPARGMRGRLLALIAVAVVVAAVIVAVILGFPGGSDDGSGDTAGDKPSQTPSDSGSASASGAPSTAPTDTPTTAPTSSPAAPKGPPKLAASAPKRLVVNGLVDAGFGESISPSGSRYIVQSPTLLLRDGTKGLPGSPGTATTVVVGASTQSGTGAFDALDQVTKGATVELQNDAGTLTYKVSSVGKHAPDDVPALKALTTKATDRLVLVVAHYDDGQRLGDDTVVIAKLTGAHKG